MGLWSGYASRCAEDGSDVFAREKEPVLDGPVSIAPDGQAVLGAISLLLVAAPAGELGMVRRAARVKGAGNALQAFKDRGLEVEYDLLRRHVEILVPVGIADPLVAVVELDLELMEERCDMTTSALKLHQHVLDDPLGESPPAGMADTDLLVVPESNDGTVGSVGDKC